MLKQRLTTIRNAAIQEGYTSYEVRIGRLKKLDAILVDHQSALIEAADKDFNGRPAIQTRMEIFGALESIRYTTKNLKRWMKPDKRDVPFINRLTGASAEILHQPLGVVGVVAPWNFPYVLSLGALAGVFAGGNRAMLKPSELCPNVSALLAELIGEKFDKTELDVVLGGPEVGQEFCSLAFDHLLFTGAPSIASHVMRAAAENLVPMTLELGGKCPVVVSDSGDLDLAVDRIMWGKVQNAGQICLAPDYVFVPQRYVEEFLSRAREKIAAWHNKPEHDAHFCSIINDRHLQRLQGYIDEAQEKGARVESLKTSSMSLPGRQIAPHIFVEPDDDLGVMRDEVFGPLLSLKGYTDIQQVIDYINLRERPLALYYFGSNSSELERLKKYTVSGGMSVNDIATHASCETLPLGGVGHSGMGAYHGYHGFLEFTHPKAILKQKKISMAKLFNPPYTKRQSKILDKLIG